MHKRRYFDNFDPTRVPSPCFVIDKAAVEDNLKILHRVGEASGAKVLAALKAFSCWSLGDLFQRYLSGSCASGVNEARLAREYYGGEVHTYSAAYKPEDLEQVLQLSDHVLFNSLSQWERFQATAMAAKQKRPSMQFGLRINPEHSEGDVPIYDPCAPKSRMGIPRAQFSEHLPEGITGLHFHTLCEHDVPPLARTIKVVEEKFGTLLHQAQWVNFGGGHHISREDYQVDELIALIRGFAQRYNVQVYIEPGEATAIRSGVLVAEVLDTFVSTVPQAILDTSATCHMPDTLEMPYRADILNAGMPDEKAHTYRLGGMTCLAGDVIGDYSFDAPLEVGQRLVFDDMAHYTMVKTTTFNGINLPAIAIWDSRTEELQVIREFGYEDFKSRLS
ncbi:carboxynorspermidine decarboxylase [Gilvimarinus agarilyticus]|uniref:carboxynorspermidine decarboxylase n=1 Tax=unclassified Gilvimarinus TaxID=2642066 RepID=UPI001C086B85|nr:MULTISPECIES: carboxynorspermidine decarboxylase [unclassified Gilvimarinus]MBU2887399.1 carboxynorspermidine decarboxylase [Gilvimarinus agarilyticus]MDO6572058.1 carboxynorspermidine decarboxylase [Gilvimarinus sp. 2_MG-2023]MDO6746118.1 carboxynorspermidine decarboxylase [Gilvimarinus sp. 1_MG-2023]